MSSIDYESIKQELKPQEKFLYEKILYYHDKVSSRNKRLNLISNILKISVFILAGGTTVVLGIENEGFEVLAKNLAIVFGALITLISAVLGYLNIERFWMRSVTNHLKINKLRDKFIFFHSSGEGMTEKQLKEIFEELMSITNHNIEYWENAIGEIERS